MSQVGKRRPRTAWNPAAPLVHPASHPRKSLCGRRRLSRSGARRRAGRTVLTAACLGNCKHRGRGDSDVTRHDCDRLQGSVNIVSGCNHSGAPCSSQTPVHPVGSGDQPHGAGHLARSPSSRPERFPASVSCLRTSRRSDGVLARGGIVYPFGKRSAAGAREPGCERCTAPRGPAAPSQFPRGS